MTNFDPFIMELTALIVCALFAYLLGSVSFAIVVSRLFKLSDPRSYGSGNPGATNVLRSGNKLAAVFTLLGDCLKGFVAVFVATLTTNPFLIFTAGLCVFLGHIFPVFHQFKGGKGVATALGVLLAMDVVLGVFTLSIWIIVFFFTRYSSLAAIVASLCAPLLCVFGLNKLSALPLCVTLCAFLLFKHQPNIARLIEGTESRFGEKKEKLNND